MRHNRVSGEPSSLILYHHPGWRAAREPARPARPPRGTARDQPPPTNGRPPVGLLRDDMECRVRIAERAGLDMLVQRPPRLAFADRLDPDAFRHGATALVNQRGRAPGTYTPLQKPLGRRRTPILCPPPCGLPVLLDRDPSIQLGKTRLRLLHDHATREVQQLKTRRHVGHVFDSRDDFASDSLQVVPPGPLGDHTISTGKAIDPLTCDFSIVHPRRSIRLKIQP